jgi:hypothetical protein
MRILLNQWFLIAQLALAGCCVHGETLADHLATNAVGRAQGRSGTSDDLKEVANWGYNVYSGTNLFHLTNSIWSTNCWLHDVSGLSATDIGCSNGMGGQGLFTMVSPRHYLFATHMHPESFLAAFLGTNNVIYWRKTLERVDVNSDTSVGILNADLPPSVGYLPVLPKNYGDYIPTKTFTVIQGIGMNQEMLLFSQPMVLGDSPFIRWNCQGIIPSGLSTNWSQPIRGGDSSNPEMLLIKNQLVLVSHNYGVGAGPNYALQIDAINEKMHYLSAKYHLRKNYQLTIYPLSDWTPAGHTASSH